MATERVRSPSTRVISSSCKVEAVECLALTVCIVSLAAIDRYKSESGTPLLLQIYNITCCRSWDRQRMSVQCSPGFDALAVNVQVLGGYHIIKCSSLFYPGGPADAHVTNPSETP